MQESEGSPSTVPLHMKWIHIDCGRSLNESDFFILSPAVHVNPFHMTKCNDTGRKTSAQARPPTLVLLIFCQSNV